MMNKIKKALFWMMVLLLGLVGLGLAYAFIFYPPEYTVRLLRWGDADVYDYEKFPERPLPPSDAPFHFTHAPNETLVRELFARETAVDNLDTFLQQTGTQAFIVIQ
ncbi:MAG: hypothetical protein GY805_08835, partial [Chloroflexi bacterium]|nr:hypothetical protein [Chloroflexota bacterium]